MSPATRRLRARHGLLLKPWATRNAHAYDSATTRAWQPMTRAAGQRGLGAVAAIAVLVVLAALAAAVVRLGSAAQTGAAQDVLGARAWQAARAGTDWGLYQAFKGAWSACSNATQTLDLVTETGFRVTVRCDSRSFNEGESAPGTPQTVRVYAIDAVACNGAATCPDDGRAARPGYVERRLQVQATD
jgi:MSHA biogenesis protein MshP